MRSRALLKTSGDLGLGQMAGKRRRSNQLQLDLHAKCVQTKGTKKASSEKVVVSLKDAKVRRNRDILITNLRKSKVFG